MQSCVNSMCTTFFPPEFKELGLHEFSSTLLTLSCFSFMPGWLAVCFRIFCIQFIVRVALWWPILAHSSLNKILTTFALSRYLLFYFLKFQFQCLFGDSSHWLVWWHFHRLVYVVPKFIRFEIWAPVWMQ